MARPRQNLELGLLIFHISNKDYLLCENNGCVSSEHPHADDALFLFWPAFVSSCLLDDDSTATVDTRAPTDTDRIHQQQHEESVECILVILWLL